MRPKWWKHPRMVLFYGLLGAIAGAVAGIMVFGLLINWAIDILNAGEGYMLAYSGVSGVALIAEAITFSVALGSATGCAIVHAFGKYRFEAGWILIIYATLVAILSGIAGLDAVPAYGIRFALAFNGMYCAYSILLFIGGGFMVARPKNHWG